MYSIACLFFQPNISLNVVKLRNLLIGATFWISFSQICFENVLLECRSDLILTVNFTTNLTSVREARSVSPGTPPPLVAELLADSEWPSLMLQNQ